jgi:DUF1365 family protein
MKTALLPSGVYEGVVMHARIKPHAHRFNYKVAMVYLDLDELPALFSKSPFWSMERWNLAIFRRCDFHDQTSLPLKQAVINTVERSSGQTFRGRVFMLANLRYFGFIINPITLYYCFDEENLLSYVVAEVTNTPWHERCQYVLKTTSQDGSAIHEFSKAMHVSPFMPMNLLYQWHSSSPGQELSVNMSLIQDGNSVFAASMKLEYAALNRSRMHRLLWEYPLMTLQVGLGIYWQALRLWLKGNPVYPHPPHVDRSVP